MNRKLAREKKNPDYNFDNLKLTKKNKLLFIYYTDEPNMEIENDLYDDEDYDILYIQYTNPLDNNKIISWLNNKFDYVIITINKSLSKKEYDNLCTYCRFIKNPENIMILFKYSMTLFKNLNNVNIKFNKKLLIRFMKSPYYSYPIKYNTILFIPDSSYEGRVNLSDTWFYKYTKQKFYSCATNRLRQISGTCYANAVLNCIILTPSLRALFFLKMKKDLSKDKELKKEINKPITQKCPVSKRYFVYQFLYNLLCTDFRPQIGYKPTDNIMSIATKNIVDVTDYEYYSQIFSDVLFKEVFTDNYFSEYNNYPYKYMNKTIFFPLYSILNYNDEQVVKVIYGNDLTTKIKHIDDYKPLACCIFVQNKSLNFNHLICGYICNGKKMIYDSGNNYLGEHDWRDDMSDFRIKIEDNNYYKFISFVGVYYVKKDMIKELESTKICP